MSTLNKWLGIGRLTADPQTRPGPGGLITTFTIAINERWKKGDTPTQSTTFVPVMAHGGLAESAAQFLKKGREVLVEGKLQIESYEDKDHAKHVRPSIRAENIQFLGQGAGTERLDETRPREPRPVPAGHT